MNTVHIVFDPMIYRKIIHPVVIASVLMALIISEILLLSLRSLITIASAESPNRLVFRWSLGNLLIGLIVIDYNLILLFIFKRLALQILRGTF